MKKREKDAKEMGRHDRAAAYFQARGVHSLTAELVVVREGRRTRVAHVCRGVDANTIAKFDGLVRRGSLFGASKKSGRSESQLRVGPLSCWRAIKQRLHVRCLERKKWP